ncbi:MAG: phosphatidate cytidylyltransferase [candidate division Zixibacteria bacterium]|nr:phosphatidate cytidylyltransferase [candidate division Zixibacteria bacterium]
MNKNLLIRTLVAAVAIPIILWICYQGGLWLWGMVTLFALVAMAEFLIAEEYKPGGPVFWLGLLAVTLNMLYNGPGDRVTSLLSPSVISLFTAIPILGVVFLLSAMAFAVGKSSPADLFRSHIRLVWGAAYLLLLYPMVFSVGNMGQVYEAGNKGSGGDWLLLLFGLLWLGDTAAMFIGKAFGKHKLAPGVSPNKTVEGFIGGILGAVVVAVILGFWRLHMIPMWQLVLIAAVCSVFGQLGDLVESMWKRSLNLKDSSALIPGHGGVLDRFDSLLFAAPVMYYAMLLIGK